MGFLVADYMIWNNHLGVAKEERNKEIKCYDSFENV